MELQFDLGLINQAPEKDLTNTMHNQVDVAIIGAGPAGLSAAIYAQRKGLKTIVIGGSAGGQINDTSSVENYPGFPSVSGETLSHKFYDHARSLDIPIQKGLQAVEVVDQKISKTVKLDTGETIKAKVLIVATGSKHRKLGVEGEDRLAGRGVAYCAICDGPLFHDRQVVVAGGGNAAVEAAIDLSKIARKVILVHRSQFRADQILIDRMKQSENIETHLETQIMEIIGENKVTGVRLKSKQTQTEQIISAEGVFVEVGYTPNTSIFKNQLEMNAHGEILTDEKMHTSVPGIFAAGDVVAGPYKQIIIAAGDGAKAALSANEYINHLINEEELNDEIA